MYPRNVALVSMLLNVDAGRSVAVGPVGVLLVDGDAEHDGGLLELGVEVAPDELALVVLAGSDGEPVGGEERGGDPEDAQVLAPAVVVEAVDLDLAGVAALVLDAGGLRVGPLLAEAGGEHDGLGVLGEGLGPLDVDALALVVVAGADLRAAGLDEGRALGPDGEPVELHVLAPGGVVVAGDVGLEAVVVAVDDGGRVAVGPLLVLLALHAQDHHGLVVEGLVEPVLHALGLLLALPGTYVDGAALLGEVRVGLDLLVRSRRVVVVIIA